MKTNFNLGKQRAKINKSKSKSIKLNQNKYTDT